MARPLIGVTTYVEQASWGHWAVEAALIPYDYVRGLERAGARVLLVPPDEEGVEETLEALDGLVLSGGNDLEPASYGAESHPQTAGTNPRRDRGELALLDGALARDMPVLAVCRGFEVLNVARGGDLVQHLPDELGHERHREVPGRFSDHGVRLDESSRLGSLLGSEVPSVKSHHHQGLGRIGAGLRATAWADDGTVEAVEDPDKRFALGVLWHPEAADDTKLFEALVSEAHAYREEKRSVRS